MQKKIYTEAYVSYYIDLQVATSHTGTRVAFIFRFFVFNCLKNKEKEPEQPQVQTRASQQGNKESFPIATPRTVE